MAIIYNSALKTTRMTDVRAAIDAGGGSPTAGRLQIGNAGFLTILAEVTLANPCGIVSGDTLTFTMPQAGSVIATGSASEARLIDSSNVVIASGLTVGTSGTNAIINTTSLTAGETVTVNSAAIQHG